MRCDTQNHPIMAPTWIGSFVFVIVGLSTSWSQELWRPRQLGIIELEYPGYVELIGTADPLVDPLDNYTLYVSTFDSLALFRHDDIYYMRSPGRFLNEVENWQLTKIDSTHYWPNDLMYMPSEVVGTEGIIWTSGFLVPTKTEGHLSLYLTTTDPLDGPYNIASLDDKEYSYHRVEWHDVNHDGFLDALAARFRVAGGDGLASMVWYENPGLGVPSEAWTQHIIFEDGPDVHFRLTQFIASGENFWVLVGAEFWNEQLTLYYAADGSDSFLSDPSTLIQQKIDTTIGQAFDVAITDLNLDGRPEILLTAFNITEGRVFVYPVPDDFRVDPFERYIIADGFIPNNVGEGNYMSPGAPNSFYRGVEQQSSGDKPYVFVSGDDDGSHYILTPDSEDPADWSYNKHVLVDTNATIAGKFSIADLDNDGFNEVIATGYSAGQIYVYTYSP